jgi:hypothetical protein
MATNALYKDAFIAFTSVGAIMWTGGLIILQIRSGSANQDEQQRINEHYLINSGMGCAAYSFLVATLALFAAGITVQHVTGVFAIYYGIVTRGHWGGLLRSLINRDATWGTVAFGNLLPTVELAILAFFPAPQVIIWTLAASTYVSYYFLSYMVQQYAPRRPV